MKIKAMIIFLSIVILVNTLVNLYLFYRTKPLVGSASDTVMWIFRAAFWLVAFAYVIGRFTERSGAMAVAEPFIKMGSWWLGAMLYLTLGFLLVDILRGVNALFNITDILKFSWQSPKGQMASIGVYAVALVILVIGYFNAKYPVVNQLTINVNKPIEGGEQRIVLLSDIHLGTMIANGRLERMVRKVNEQNPDVVLLAGDVFDEDLGPVISNNMGDLLKNLKAKYGVYAVTGNHEFFGNVNAAQAYLEQHGITVLRDSIAALPNGFTIVGRDDRQANHMLPQPRKSVEQLVAGANQNTALILMDHQPYQLEEAVNNGIDLQVSGHTHHGQMWPFGYVTSKIFEVSRGHKQKGNTHIYVSTGYGTWGPPIRTGNRPELVVIDMVNNL